jgi:hypothetical protein
MKRLIFIVVLYVLTLIVFSQNRFSPRPIRLKNLSYDTVNKKGCQREIDSLLYFLKKVSSTF